MIVNNIKCYACSWFPPKGYTAITLFGRVIFRCSKEQLENIYNNDRMLRILNHKRIHILQGEELGWITFYILYLYYYLVNLFSYHDHNVAYHHIPFEMEAYDNENNPYYRYSIWEYYV